MVRNVNGYLKIYEWAIYSLGLTSKMVVFSYLYSFYENNNYNNYQSFAEISKRLFMSVSTVQNAIRELLKIGLIEKEIYNSNCHCRRGNRYNINQNKVNELIELWVKNNE